MQEKSIKTKIDLNGKTVLVTGAARGIGKGPGSHIGPVTAIGRLAISGIKISRVLSRIECFEPAVASFDGGARWPWARTPSGQSQADGLVVLIRRKSHE